MDDTLHSGQKRRPAHVLRASNIHRVIVLYRTPHAGHSSQMEYPIHTLHRRSKVLRVANIAVKDFDMPLCEPACILCRKGQDTHTVTTLLQRQHKIATDKAVAASNQHLHSD